MRRCKLLSTKITRRSNRLVVSALAKPAEVPFRLAAESKMQPEFYKMTITSKRKKIPAFTSDQRCDRLAVIFVLGHMHQNFAKLIATDREAMNQNVRVKLFVVNYEITEFSSILHRAILGEKQLPQGCLHRHHIKVVVRIELPKLFQMIIICQHPGKDDHQGSIAIVVVLRLELFVSIISQTLANSRDIEALILLLNKPNIRDTDN